MRIDEVVLQVRQAYQLQCRRGGIACQWGKAEKAKVSQEKEVGQGAGRGKTVNSSGEMSNGAIRAIRNTQRRRDGLERASCADLGGAEGRRITTDAPYT